MKMTKKLWLVLTSICIVTVSVFVIKNDQVVSAKTTFTTQGINSELIKNTNKTEPSCIKNYSPERIDVPPQGGVFAVTTAAFPFSPDCRPQGFGCSGGQCAGIINSSSIGCDTYGGVCSATAYFRILPNTGNTIAIVAISADSVGIADFQFPSFTRKVPLKRRFCSASDCFPTRSRTAIIGIRG